jgi:hypothetical protein
MFIRQNKGTLSKKRREAEFRQLTDDEVRLIEGIVADAFEGVHEAGEQTFGPDAGSQ